MPVPSVGNVKYRFATNEPSPEPWINNSMWVTHYPGGHSETDLFNWQALSHVFSGFTTHNPPWFMKKFIPRPEVRCSTLAMVMPPEPFNWTIYWQPCTMRLFPRIQFWSTRGGPDFLAYHYVYYGGEVWGPPGKELPKFTISWDWWVKCPTLNFPWIKPPLYATLLKDPLRDMNGIFLMTVKDKIGGFVPLGYPFMLSEYLPQGPVLWNTTFCWDLNT